MNNKWPVAQREKLENRVMARAQNVPLTALVRQIARGHSFDKLTTGRFSHPPLHYGQAYGLPSTRLRASSVAEHNSEILILLMVCIPDRTHTCIAWV